MAWLRVERLATLDLDAQGQAILGWPPPALRATYPHPGPVTATADTLEC
jgi:hypothetical protein